MCLLSCRSFELTTHVVVNVVVTVRSGVTVSAAQSPVRTSSDLCEAFYCNTKPFPDSHQRLTDMDHGHITEDSAFSVMYFIIKAYPEILPSLRHSDDRSRVQNGNR